MHVTDKIYSLYHCKFLFYQNIFHVKSFWNLHFHSTLHWWHCLETREQVFLLFAATIECLQPIPPRLGVCTRLWSGDRLAASMSNDWWTRLLVMMWCVSSFLCEIISLITQEWWVMRPNHVTFRYMMLLQTDYNSLMHAGYYLSNMEQAGHIMHVSGKEPV